VAEVHTRFQRYYLPCGKDKKLNSLLQFVWPTTEQQVRPATEKTIKPLPRFVCCSWKSVIPIVFLYSRAGQLYYCQPNF